MNSRCTLDSMPKEKSTVFTVPMTLEEIAEFHTAAAIKDNRNATGLVYNFMRRQVREAKAEAPEEFKKLLSEKRQVVLARSKRKSKERKKNGGTSNGLVDESPMTTARPRVITPRRKKTPAKKEQGGLIVKKGVAQLARAANLPK